jgi:hypothetical protein
VRGHKVQRVILDQQVHKGQAGKEHRDLKGILEIQELKDQQDQQELRDLMDHQLLG